MTVPDPPWDTTRSERASTSAMGSVVSGHRQQVKGISVAWRRWHDRQVPVQHAERVAGVESVLGSQFRQRFPDDVGAYQAASSDHNHPSVGDPVRLGGHGSGKVHLVSNEQVRLPLADQVEESASPFTGDAPRKELADHSLLGEAVDGRQRTALGRSEQCRPASRHSSPPLRGDRRDHRLLTRIPDLVPTFLERSRERRGREEVSAAARECEQDSHSIMMLRRPGLCRGGPSRAAQPGSVLGRSPAQRNSPVSDSGARIRHASVTSSASRSASTSASRSITSGQPS